MTSRRARAAIALFAIAASLLISGCGVRLQADAVPVPPNVIPAPLRLPQPSPSPVASETPSAIPSTTPQVIPDVQGVRLWFVEDDGLSSALSDLPAGTPPDVIVQALAIGPTPEQSSLGLRTVASDPLTGLSFVSVLPATSTPEEAPSGVPTEFPSATPTSTTPGVTPSVNVALSSAFAALPPVEQVLLLGQVVLSLTGAGQESVQFTDEAGTPVAVPLPDGRLLDGPATARDFGGLIVRP